MRGAGAIISLNQTNPWNTQINYEWVIFDASGNNANVPIITNNTANPTIDVSSLSVGNYKIRYRVQEICCGWSKPVYITFTVAEQAQVPTASMSPATNICLGQNITLTNPVDNGGGAGSCNFEYRSSIDNGSTWTTWTTSVPNISSSSQYTNQNIIQIRRTCDGVGCVSSAPQQYSWNVQSPETTGIGDGDYIWSGNVNVQWPNASNWLRFNGSYVGLSGDYPNVNTANVFIRDYGDCANNVPATLPNSTINCNNITIDNSMQLNMGTTSILNVYGDWNNYGTFNSSTGKVAFKGSSQQHIKSNNSDFYDIEFSNSNLDANIILTDNLKVTHAATFTNGIVTTGSNKFVFTAAATTTEGTANSFVDGTIEKLNQTLAFTFPSGNVNTRNIGQGLQTYKIWAPFTATPSAATNVTVRYLFSNEGLNQWWYHVWTHQAPLTHTSDREYWIVNATNPLKATIYWKNNDPCYIHDLCIPATNTFLSSYLTLAYWDGIWKDGAPTNSPVGDYQNGYITSSATIPFGAKGERQITFGAKDTELPLPIDLVKFYANCEDNSAFVTWITASETNNAYFILEKSQEAETWFEFARIAGAGNSNTQLTYSVTDSELFAGDNYYRLKQVDFDGRISTYNLISINCDKYGDGTTSLIAYPNPFTNELNVVIENLQESEFVLELYDNIGKLIFSQEYSTTETSFHTVLDLNSLLPAVYNLRSRSEGSVMNVKVVKR